jgi:hypothetical protein
MEDFVHDPSVGTNAIEKESGLPSLNVPPMELPAQRARRAKSGSFSSLPAPR